jgi:hypothetical protein
MILHVLNGCETWSITLREEYKLRVFENKMLKRIFGLKRQKVVGDCRRLHSDDLNLVRFSKYYSDQIKDVM